MVGQAGMSGNTYTKISHILVYSGKHLREDITHTRTFWQHLHEDITHTRTF